MMDVEFSGWVRTKIDERNQAVVKEKKLAVNMDPEIMAAFLNSTAVSSKFKLSLHTSIASLTHHFLLL